MDLARMAALIAVLATAVVHGTDVFCALVQRPALARVDDRALTAIMGNVHRYGDRRMPVPGALGLIAAATSAVRPGWLAGGLRPRRRPPRLGCCWFGLFCMYG
jgi:hypothetical protein